MNGSIIVRGGPVGSGASTEDHRAPLPRGQRLPHSIPQIDVDCASRDQLVAHIDELEFIIDDLMPRKSDVVGLREAFGCSETEARILAPLMTGVIHSSRQLRRASQKWGDADNITTVTVLVHRLRKKLARHGITIRNVFGHGYVIDAADVRRLKSITGEGA